MSISEVVFSSVVVFSTVVPFAGFYGPNFLDAQISLYVIFHCNLLIFIFLAAVGWYQMHSLLPYWLQLDL